ncbi:hypothetical protein EB118_26245, partial [bacterium]|nr:hypothetical protein [bacterium]
ARCHAAADQTHRRSRLSGRSARGIASNVPRRAVGRVLPPRPAGHARESDPGVASVDRVGSPPERALGNVDVGAVDAAGAAVPHAPLVQPENQSLAV